MLDLDHRKKERKEVVRMIKTITIKWAVSQPMVRGSHIGQFDTQEEAQAVADAQEVFHRVTKWTIHEFKFEQS